MLARGYLLKNKEFLKGKEMQDKDKLSLEIAHQQLLQAYGRIFVMPKRLHSLDTLLLKIGEALDELEKIREKKRI